MSDLVLARLDTARTALAEAKTIQETKSILDVATAAEVLAKRQKMGEEAINYATSIKVEALAQLGRMLQEMPKNPGTRPNQEHGGTMLEPPSIPTLADMGLDKKTSKLAQDIASLPEEEFNKVRNGAVAITRALAKTINKNTKKRNQDKDKTAADKIKDIPNITLYNKDFRDCNEIKDNSVDFIFTDPPYDAESVPLYGDLAIFASRVLKDGGSLITYAGHYSLPEIFNLMTPHLRYWWMCAIKHSGGNARLPGKWVYVEWKPLLWFVKNGRSNKEFVADFINSDAPDKKFHEWEQGSMEAGYYINLLTRPGDVVVDPFAGSGTTCLAAQKLGRKSVGIELDEPRFNSMKVKLDANIAR